MNDHADIAMQTRCVHCLTEQYVLNVIAVSYGDAACSWCGQYSHEMTKEQYMEALTEAREAQQRNT